MEENNNEYKEIKLINEVVVYKSTNSDNDKYIIAIEFSESYGKGLAIDPYFKVYEGKSYTQAKSDIRFYLRDGHADKHTDGKKKLAVTNELVDFVAETLKSNCKVKGFEYMTVYDAIWKVIMDYAKPRNYPYLNYIPIDEFLRNFYAKNYR